MKPTIYPKINKLLANLLSQIQKILGNKFVGLYLYGSATAGDFDQSVSDLDLLAVIERDITEQEFSILEKMHSDFAVKYPKWKDRIEVAYLPAEGLREFKNRRSRITIISPGEPLNIKTAGNDWLINWFDVQENGIVLFGPNQTTFIPYISKAEYMSSIKERTNSWLQRIKSYDDKSSLGSLAFTVFTMCRALYGYKIGEQTSKKQAVLWLTKEFPEWGPLIDEATGWRRAQWDDIQKKDAAALPKVIEFVNFVTGQISE